MPTEHPVKNPYVCGHPVEGWEFYGRADELSRIFTQLSRNGHYSVVGSPRMGKTSLLLHIGLEGVAERYGLQSSDRLFAYCNLKTLPAETSLGAFLSEALQKALKKRLASRGENQGALESVLESLEQYDPSGTLRRGMQTASNLAGKAFSAMFKNVKDQLAPHLQLPPAAPDPDGLVQLSRALEQLHSKGLKPVLLIDDAENLFRSQTPLEEHLAALGKLMGGSGCAFVLATSKRLRDLLQRDPPFEMLRLRLGALEPEDGRSLLSQPARGVEVDYPDEWVERTVAFTGYHPFLLQTYAFHIFPSLRDRRTPDRLRLEEEVLEEVRGTLEEQLAWLGTEERGCLQQHLLMPASEECEADARLRREGILTPDGKLTTIYRKLAPPPVPASQAPLPVTPTPVGERSLLEVIEERIRLDTYLRERFTQVGTFVDIDVAGSTQLKQGEDDYDVIYSFEEFHNFQREVIEASKGRILNAIGDETMSLFNDPEEALQGLKNLLGALSQFNRTRNRLKNPFQVRAGVHLGELIRDQREDRAYSRVLDIAGHLQKLAEDGSVVVSQQVFDALGQPAYLAPYKYAERDGIMSFKLLLQ